jgi:hypothetical protein
VRRPPGVTLVAGAICAVSTIASGAADPVDVRSLLARLGARVEAYFARAQSIVCTETVRLQSLDFGLSPDRPARVLVYELRVEWDSAAEPGEPSEATVFRQIRTINGRPARESEEPGCMDPKPVSLDPMAFLLPRRQSDFTFSSAGTSRSNGRPVAMLDYRAAGSPPPRIAWKGDCVTIDVPDRTRGRVWVDAESGDILRLDERLLGPFDVRVPNDRRRNAPSFMVVDRADSSIRYKAVSFRDPEETLMLPESIDSIAIVRGSSIPRLRTTQKFSNYRRFMTGGRIVQE